MAEKELIVVAGPNGAGKTTFAEEFLVERPMPCLSADAIAAELSPNDPTSARFAAGREFLIRLDKLIAGDESFLVESTLSGRSFRRDLRIAKSNGSTIAILFVFLDSPDTCVVRVRERVRAGGHDVPETDVRRRYARSLANFWREYRKLADRWSIIYNASIAFQEVAVGERAMVSVAHESLFSRYLTLAGVAADE